MVDAQDGLLKALASGWLLDALIALVLLEAVLLLAWQRRTGAGLGASRLLPTLLAGLGLIVAWRASVAGAPAAVVALALAVAGAAHVLDLAGRWVRPGAPANPEQGPRARSDPAAGLGA